MSTDDDQPRTLELENLLENVIRLFLDQVRTGLPGKIVSYDSDKQKASVQILIQFGEIIAGDRVVQPIAPLVDVPVIFTGGNGGKTRRTYPVVAGDLCWVMFSSSSMALFKSQGAPNGTVDPGDDARHRLSDAVCIVGGHTFNDVPTDAPTDAIVENLASGIVMKIGNSSAATKVQTTVDGAQFLQCLAFAIYDASPLGGSPNPTTLATLTALYGALTGGSSVPSVPTLPAAWPTGSSVLLTNDEPIP